MSSLLSRRRLAVLCEHSTSNSGMVNYNLPHGGIAITLLSRSEMWASHSLLPTIVICSCHASEAKKPRRSSERHINSHSRTEPPCARAPRSSAGSRSLGASLPLPVPTTRVAARSPRHLGGQSGERPRNGRQERQDCSERFQEDEARYLAC